MSALDGVGDRLQAPPAVRWIVRTLEEAGFETWTVGGAVRDALLGHPGGDWDLATRARPGQIRSTFRRTVPIGIDHGTVGVLTRDGTMYEVTTFRRDLETDGRHARVAFADRIEDDLARRDFTINAVAWHPIREELLDPHGGVDDLEARVLRTVGSPEERFREDYLRVLRALRFAGQLSLTVTPESWQALCDGRTRLGDLSAERIREELLKVLSGSDRPSRALGLYAASGVLGEVIPELDATVGMEDPAAPGDGVPPDLWSRCLLSADRISRARPLLRLAALFRGVGVPPAGAVRFSDAPDPGDSSEPWTRGALRTAAVLERLRFSNAEIRDTGGLVEALLRPLPDPEDRVAVRRWLADVGASRLNDVVRVHGALVRLDASAAGTDPGEPAGDGSGDYSGVGRLTALWRGSRAELRAGAPLSVGDLALDGRDLIAMGMRPGPHFASILNELLDRVLEDPHLNRPGKLRELVEAHPEWREPEGGSGG